MVAKQTRRLVTTRNGRYQVSLLHANIRDLKLRWDPVWWYDEPRKKKPCPAYGVRVWTYQVTDTKNPSWSIEIELGYKMKIDAKDRGSVAALCIRAVRITGGLVGVETIQLPVAELLQACCRVGAVTGVSYPPGSTLPDGTITGNKHETHGKTEHDEIDADDVSRVSGFGYNKRLGAKHPETVAQALRLANEHKIKKEKNETTQTQIDYVHQRMWWYSKDSLKVALKVGYANEKNKPKKRKKQ